ncbi:MAG: hypothetical protein WC998_00805 [Candidatus Paceibacterota bacterium]|jgi:hypothetical protein
MWFWKQIWNFCEFYQISLGKFAPWVFEKAFGLKGELIGFRDKRTNEIVHLNTKQKREGYMNKETGEVEYFDNKGE